MSSSKGRKPEDLDKELTVLRHLIEKENQMLRTMISSLDALEKKMIHSQKKRTSKAEKKR
jgi:uncharacterized coiled-coil protein SlyX